MKKIVFSLLIFGFLGCTDDPVQPNTSTPNTVPTPVGEMRTYFSEDWDNWDFFLGDSANSTIDVYTYFSEDWDGWVFQSTNLNGQLYTYFSQDWDSWTLATTNYTIKLKTAFTEDWDNWDIDDSANNWHCDVRTAFTEDWDNWDADDATNNVHLDLKTAFSDDWDNWDVYGQWGTNYPIEYQIAISFVPVIVNVLRVQGIIP